MLCRRLRHQLVFAVRSSFVPFQLIRVLLVVSAPTLTGVFAEVVGVLVNVPELEGADSRCPHSNIIHPFWTAIRSDIN